MTIRSMMLTARLVVAIGRAICLVISGVHFLAVDTMIHPCIFFIWIMRLMVILIMLFFFSSRRRHTRYWRDWSSDVCSSDLDFPDHKLIVMSTGSQGEPGSALRRMAHNDHPAVELKQGDTVVFSATPIPGNERAINDTIDRLFRIGCTVVTAKDAPIHASGHGHSEEIKLMANLVKPRYLLPVHGDHKRIRLHGELAQAAGMNPDNILRGENGTPLEIDENGARFAEREQSGMIFVDGLDIGDVNDVALRDRRMLSADGIFVVVATVSEQTGQSVADPEVIFRGVPFTDEAEQLLDDLRGCVDSSLERAAQEEIREVDLLTKVLHDDLAKLVYDRLRRRPMMLPVVVEV